jgi:chromosome segregation ATPase
MSRATSLATLRDTITRLKRVRVTCGKNDDDVEQKLLTGNIFEDNINKFVTEFKALQEFMEEKRENMKKFGNDRETIILSQDVRKKTKELEEILAEAKKVIDEKDEKLAKYNVQLSNGENKKIQKKHDTLKSECDKCKGVYDKCVKELELAKEGLTKSMENKDNGRNISPARKKRISALRDNMDKFNKRKLNGGEGNEVEMTAEEKAEYDIQMKEVNQKNALIDKSLDRIKAGVERLNHIAINIGVEVETQNRMLDNTEIKVDTANKDLRGLNRGLTKLMREQKPLTLWLKVSAVIFVVAIIGYFLYQFNVV